MVPRHKIDLTVADLLFAAAACAVARSPAQREDAVLRTWGRQDALVCLSVRSGFDLLLDALALPQGSEALVSAITHPDIVRILERHRLVPVPVELDLTKLAPQPGHLERALTARTRLLLVAHLFGGRVDLAPLAEVARTRGLLLVEDCAQSFGVGPPGGDPLADVSLFSFGPIKTSTALGGAVVRVADPALLARMRGLESRRPRQRRSAYACRVARFAGLAILAHPAIYGALARLVDLDRVVTRSVRGLPGSEEKLFERLRVRPSAPLLTLLARRLRRFDGAVIAERARAGEEVALMLSPQLVRPGAQAADRTHWVFPIVADDPGLLVEALRSAGFDAARGTTALGVVPAPAGRPELEARAATDLMRRVVFLPVYPRVGARGRRRLTEAANASLAVPEARERSSGVYG